MPGPEEFAAVCRERARQVRRLPADVKRALSARVRPEVVEPVAADMRAAATGPHAALLAAGVKPRTGATPELVIGGARPRISGGASPRDVVFGDEFGGGSRVTEVPARQGRRAYRRHTTRQFKRRPFAFPTIARDLEKILDGYATIVTDTLEETL